MLIRCCNFIPVFKNITWYTQFYCPHNWKPIHFAATPGRKLQRKLKFAEWFLDCSTVFWQLFGCCKTRFWPLMRRQLHSPNICHYTLSKSVVKNFVTTLDFKAQPSASVRFEPGTLWFWVEILSHSVTLSCVDW